MTELNAVDERWRPVPGYPGYSVSDHGRVRSDARTITDSLGRERRLQGYDLRAGRTTSGYYTVSLSGRTCSVHHLVLTAFVGPRPPRMEGCHDDDDKADNRLVNLRWDSRRENTLDRVRNGIHHKRNRTHCPLDHLLVPPNLHASMAAKGYRNCLACHRARANRQYAKKAGRSFDLKAAADAHYAKIMENL